MTYLQFHFVFTIPLFLVVIFMNRHLKQSFSQRSLMGCGILCLLAFLYTTPWDSYLIRQNIWTYSADDVIGTLFSIPYEELFFFFIQSITGCFFTSYLLLKTHSYKEYTLAIEPKHLVSIAFLWLFCGIGFFWLIPNNTYRYILLILFWGIPIVGLQWILGFSILRAEKKVLFLSVSLLTTYFWVADGFAISQKIWSFPPETLTGIKIFNILPLEEALFFLLTNLMVVQGYILFTRVNRIPVFKKYEWSF